MSKKELLSPGELLLEIVEDIGITKEDLAEKCGLKIETLDMVFEGKQPINFLIANKFEEVTGVPASLWLKLQKEYYISMSSRPLFIGIKWDLDYK